MVVLGGYVNFSCCIVVAVALAQTIMNMDYAPTDEDILNVRIRTTGIIEYEHLLQIEASGPLGTHKQRHTCTVVDVGGQRCERKKWMQVFVGVRSVIFVVALNHYASISFEQYNRNNMHEALQLYDRIISLKWFRVEF